jgi:1-pyrroline-5-carboxylate dehydrogenase
MGGQGFRVTYATLAVEDDQVHQAFEEGLALARGQLGRSHPFTIDGEAREGSGYRAEVSPSDRDLVVGRFAQGTREDGAHAVQRARAAAPRWAATRPEERVRALRSVADLISARRNELAALMVIEVGKNRLEALGDVEESADLIRYYCHQLEERSGFSVPMGRLSPAEETISILRPYGVWAVISPFNYPMALAAGPAAAALVAGNTVVLKPSEQGALCGLEVHRAFLEGGVPAEAFHVVTGPGPEVGRALVASDQVDGVTFTGSYGVGMQVYRSFSARYPKPTICEMGGKNPAVVSRRADLDEAAEGILRSAFGFGGQKCSACSRAYVEEAVYERLRSRLVERTRSLRVGDPLERETFLGPLIDQAAVGRLERAAAEVEAAGGRVLAGGTRLEEGDLARGNFVAPTVVEAPPSHRVFQEELFVPLVALAPVESVRQGTELANATDYGLTAGLYSQDEEEVEEFLASIEAGVVYVNRRAGATTGAWPGVQPFGGWKGSGTTGKASGGPYYLQQYLREQSRTVVGRRGGRSGDGRI